MPELKNAAETEEVIGGDVLRNSIDIVTKPVLDHLEASVLRAMGLITEQAPNLTEQEKLHSEAIMYETAALTCAGRVLQIANQVDADRQLALRGSLWSQLDLMRSPPGEPKAD